MHVGDIGNGEYGRYLVCMREYALGGVNMEVSECICVNMCLVMVYMCEYVLGDGGYV
jgi:hypothetical protein